MGGGISKSAWRARLYRGLLSLQRDLRKSGVESTYRNHELRGQNFVAYFSTLGPASNGEKMAYVVLRFNPRKRPDANGKSAGDLDFSDMRHIKGIHGSLKDGIAAVKESWYASNPRRKRRISRRARRNCGCKRRYMKRNSRRKASRSRSRR